jgi:hypothetical protein
MSNITKWQSWFKGNPTDPNSEWSELDALIAWTTIDPILEKRAVSKTPWYPWETYFWIYYKSNIVGVRHHRYDVSQTVDTKTIKSIQEATYQFTDETLEPKFKKMPMESLLTVLAFGLHAAHFDSPADYIASVTRTLHNIGMLHDPMVQMALLMQSKPWNQYEHTMALLNAINDKTPLALETVELYFCCRSTLMITPDPLAFQLLNRLHKEYPKETETFYVGEVVDLVCDQTLDDDFVTKIFRHSLLGFSASNLDAIIKKPQATIMYWTLEGSRSSSYENALRQVLNDDTHQRAFFSNIATNLNVPPTKIMETYSTALSVLDDPVTALQHSILSLHHKKLTSSLTLPAL